MVCVQRCASCRAVGLSGAFLLRTPGAALTVTPLMESVTTKALRAWRREPSSCWTLPASTVH